MITGAGQGTVVIPGAVVDQDPKVRQVVKEAKGQWGIFHGDVKAHFVVVLQTEVHIALIIEGIPSVLVEVIKGNPVQTVAIQPLTGGSIGAEGTAGDDAYIMSRIHPAV